MLSCAVIAGAAASALVLQPSGKSSDKVAVQLAAEAAGPFEIDDTPESDAGQSSRRANEEIFQPATDAKRTASHLPTPDWPASLTAAANQSSILAGVLESTDWGVSAESTDRKLSLPTRDVLAATVADSNGLPTVRTAVLEQPIQQTQHQTPIQVAEANSGSTSEPVYPPFDDGMQLGSIPDRVTMSGDENASEKLTFEFRSAPWRDVLREFARRGNFHLQMEQAPTTNFDFYDSTAYTPLEALDLFNGYLIREGYVLLRRDRMLTLVSHKEGIPDNLVPRIEPERLEDYRDNEVVTTVMTAAGASGDAAQKAFQPLLGPLGKVVGFPRSDRVVLTDTVANLKHVRAILEAADSDLSRPNTVFELNNTSAIEVAAALNEFFAARNINPAFKQNPKSTTAFHYDMPVVIIPEPQTNRILVSAPRSLMKDVERLIQQLDVPPQQVVIQAMLVEVELGNTDESGVELGLQDSVLFDRSVVDKITSSAGSVVSQTATPGFNFNNQTPGNNTIVNPSTIAAQGLSNLALGRVNGDLGYGGLVLSAGSESVSILIRALSANFNIEVLSRPSIRAVNHQPAHIQIGEQVPVVQGVSLTAVGSANPIIKQQDAGLILDVTPHIRPDGSVFIDVVAENSKFETGTGASVPIFTDATNGNVVFSPRKAVTQAQTSVGVRSGETIVLGGMIARDVTTVERKVPMLGDIPWLGNAFRYDFSEAKRNELLIFLTPYIVNSPLQAERHKAMELDRHHFSQDAATQIYGPLYSSENGMPIEEEHAPPMEWMPPSGNIGPIRPVPTPDSLPEIPDIDSSPPATTMRWNSKRR